MINSSTDSVKKLNLINRRMFITGSLKFLVMIGLVSRLFFCKSKKIKNILHFQIKTELESGNLLQLEVKLLIILEMYCR